MPRILSIGFLCLLCSPSVRAATPQFVDATPQDNFKLYWLVKAKTPLVIDGKLSEAIWQKAEALTDWGTCNYGRTRGKLKEDFIPGEIDCRAAWDDSYLYIGAKCYHRLHPNDMVEFKRNVQDVTKDIYGRECLEVHIDGNLDHATRFQSIVNPLAEKMMIWFYDFGWGILQNTDYGLDADWDVAARIEKDHWTIEVRYALSDIQVKPEVGAMFGINPCWFNWADSRARDGKRYWWQFVTWSTHDESHHDPRLYGRFILVEEKPESLEAGLRLAFPDLDRRKVMIQTADGFLVFEKGKSRVQTQDAQVRKEAQAARAAVERVKALFADNKTTSVSYISKTALPQQEEALRKVEEGLAAAGKPTRGQLSAWRRELAEVSGKVENLHWRVKTDVLLTSLQPPGK